MSILEDKNPQLTPISAYGEFGLIKHLTGNFNFSNESTEVSIGDDAAIINPENKK
jgi:thiamine-phosphate kinase